MARCNVAIVAVVLLGFTWCVKACDVIACTESGRVCGVRRKAENNLEYASFRGVPYAKQPLGELRFKELQPVEPWDDMFNATTEGPVCPQIDLIFGKMMKPQNKSEACIHANVHVPIEALPAEYSIEVTSGAPIIVFIHGGAFQSGSGDADVNGPEYLVSKGSIIITFNYRLNVLGFMSLNSASIPGNAGLRDMLTLLRWVQRNAKAFGGNPDDVTLMGQSSGATCAHLLSLSPLTEGLFRRVIIMSGTALPTLYTSSPVYAQNMTNRLLKGLGINSTDPEEIHKQLIELPIDTIMQAYEVIQATAGIATFTPVAESSFDGVTRMIDQNPEEMIKAGRGNNIPLIIGFTNAECYSLQPRIEELNPVSAVEQSPLALLPLKLLYASPEEALPNATLLEIANTIEKRYFNGNVTIERYLDFCTDGNFVYPALRLAQLRAAKGGAPVYLYQFSYSPEHTLLKETNGLDYNGAGHIEDLLLIFRANSVLGKDTSFSPTKTDDNMKDWLINFVINFSNTGSPTGNEDSKEWPAVNDSKLMYQDINAPQVFSYTELTQAQKDLLQLYSNI